MTSRPCFAGKNSFVDLIRVISALLTLLLLWIPNSLANAQTAADWTEFTRTNMQRWNPYETLIGVNNVGTMGLRWSFTLGTNPNFAPDSSPAIANGVLYVGGENNNLYALNATTGAKLWTYTAAGEFSASPAVANGVVYDGSSDGLVHAINATTGARLWTFTTGGVINSSPVVVNGVVYIGSDDQNLYALNAATGAKLWSHTTQARVLSSPAVANGLVFIGGGLTSANLIALNAATGALVWSFNSPIAGIMDSAPAVVNGVVYVGIASGFYAFNATTGAQLWSFNSSPLTSPAVANGIVYFCGFDLVVHALNASTGASVWSYQADGEIDSSPAVANGVLYVATGSTPLGGKLIALNASTGALLWSSGTPSDRMRASPAVVNGLVYFNAGNTISAFGLGGAVADLYLRVQPSPTPVTPGTVLTYTFPVWNLGPGVANHEMLTTQVPSGTTFDYLRVSGTPGLATCTQPPYGASRGEIVCSENGSMAANTTWTVRLTVKVTAPSGTVITASGTAVEASADPNSANNTATVSTTVQ